MEGNRKTEAPESTPEYVSWLKNLTPEEAVKQDEFVYNVTFARWTWDERMAYRRLWVKRKAQELRDGTIKETDLFRASMQMQLLQGGTEGRPEAGESELVAALHAKLATLDDPYSVMKAVFDTIPSSDEED